jgi:hypothetical protein
MTRVIGRPLRLQTGMSCNFPVNADKIQFRDPEALAQGKRPSETALGGAES